MSVLKKPASPDLVTVHIVSPFQCSHDGAVYGPGDTGHVPAEIAAVWILNGWATTTE